MSGSDDFDVNRLAGEFESLSPESKKEFFKKASLSCNKNVIDKAEEDLWDNLRCCALQSLDDEAADVRRVAGLFLGDLCRKFKSKIYVQCRSQIINRTASIIKLITTAGQNASLTSTDESNEKYDKDSNSDKVMESVSMHKHLDSWMCCLEKMAAGSGPEFAEHVDLELMNLISCCLNCGDMYLEQDCMKMMYTLLHDCKLGAYINRQKLQRDSSESQVGIIYKMEEQIVCVILKGMSSHNPGTRYQSCKALRKALLSIPDGNLESTDQSLALLPALWFNRYSKESGLQQLCQEIWVEVTRGEGKALMETHIQAALNYCFENLGSEISDDSINACHCLSELVRKLDGRLLGPEVVKIYEKLRRFLIEESPPKLWHLVDAVCLLVGEIVSNYPVEMNPHVDQLWERMMLLVTHPSINVEDSSALVLSKIANNCRPEESKLNHLLDLIENSFQDFLTKPEESSNPHLPLSTPLTAVVIERADVQRGRGPSIEVKPLENKCSLHMDSPIHSIYGHFCILLHLISFLSQDCSQRATNLISELWLMLDLMERRKLHDLAVLFLLRLPEFLDNLTKEKQKQQLDLFLESVVKMADQSSHLRLRDCSVSCLEKLGRSFGWSFMRNKLMLYNELFAKNLTEKYL